MCSIIFLLLVTIVSFAQKSVFVNVDYYCDGKPLKTNDYCYSNSFGTTYQITDLQFFLSNFAICVNGKWLTKSIQIKEFDGVQRQYSEPYYFDYTDSLLQNTIVFTVKERKFTVDSVRFTFGIPKELNVPYSLTDSKLARMYWPETLGGGYHYMKLNLKFIDNQTLMSLFNCHLGKGVVADGFVDNDFVVTLPVTKEKQSKGIVIRMDLDKWFTGPNPIDFNLYTKGIMGNQEVMGKILENGMNVFSVSLRN
ncbi:MAG: hypothetical protein MJ204_04685 [Bacteroidales bacterium]|nr:hypothetical protein [Bacteroidales bacterium]